MVANDTSSVATAAMKDETTSAFGKKRKHNSSSVGLSISLSDISYGPIVILEDFKIELVPGTITCLLGPSGVGKTSILKSVAGIMPLSDESEIHASDGAPLAGRISYMDQKDLLLPWASALENLLISARLRGEQADKARARELLMAVGLKGKENDLPGTLSGGMKQRVSLARALMDDAPFVLVDEPFSALDAITRHRLQALLADMCADRTTLMITHDPMEALRLGHHVYVLAGDPVKLTSIDQIDGQIPRHPTLSSLKEKYHQILELLGMGAAP
ncbi:MAG: ABC transporter ATP-binding protein [Sneathiella sp.]|nr:ABC transporter ATP-binding protein [Sneathiella sp.]